MQDATAQHQKGTVKIWVRALHDPEPALRVRAARELGELGDPSTVTELRAALRDEYPEVRKAAAMAIGLIRNLKD